MGDLGLIPREGNDNPLQYPYMEIPMMGESGRLQSMGHKKSDMTDFTMFKVLNFIIIM